MAENSNAAMLLTFSHSGFMLVCGAQNSKQADTAPVSQRYFYARIPGVRLSMAGVRRIEYRFAGNNPAHLAWVLSPRCQWVSKALLQRSDNAEQEAFAMTTLILPNFKTTSRIVAESFGKRHDDVIRRIRSLEIPPGFSARNFTAADYRDAQGKPRPAFEMTRDGFSLLVMGFTGKQAMEWKIKFLEAFNAMERELAEKPVLVKEHRRRKPAKRPAFTPEQFAASIPQEDLLLTAQGHLNEAAKRNSDHSIQLAHACLARFKDHMDQPLSLTTLYRGNIQESRSTPMKRSA